MEKRPSQKPKQWQFTEIARQQYRDHAWCCPVRLVKNNIWARLWRAEGTRRGGSALLTSVLPVLALHTSPYDSDSGNGWTSWAFLSRRQMATLAGVTKDTATGALRRLTDSGLAEVERRARPQPEGGYSSYYRLAACFYPQGDEPYAMLPARLFYGGTWFLLPSPAYRHLYIVLACLDPIGDEAGYLSRLAHAIDGDWNRVGDDQDRRIENPEKREAVIQAKALAKQRGAEPLSANDLVRYSGLGRSTVVEALDALTVPLFGKTIDASTGRKVLDIALVAKGEARPKKPTWFAPDRRAWQAFWPNDFLNAPERVEEARRRFWPRLFERNAKAR
jgi:hypothetical protein